MNIISYLVKPFFAYILVLFYKHLISFILVYLSRNAKITILLRPFVKKSIA